MVITLALPASAFGFTIMPGHYVGETSNILFGPAQIHFDVVGLDDAGHPVVRNFWCGCAAGSVWTVGDDTRAAHLVSCARA